MGFFTSYDDKFKGIMRKNAIVKIREGRFEKWWKENQCADDLATGDYDDVKRLVLNAYEQGVWDGIDEVEKSEEFEEQVKRTLAQEKSDD